MPRLSAIRVRRGTAAAWTAANPVLDAGEPGLETDTQKVKYGDGATAWNSLGYAQSGSYGIPAGKISGGAQLYSKPGFFAISQSTSGLTANRVYYEPFIVDTPQTFDQIAVEVTTLGAGAMRVGLYNADDEWQPTSLILEIGTPFDLSSASLKTADISQALSPGRYLAAYTTNVAVTMRVLRSPGMIGQIAALGATPIVYEVYGSKAYAALAATGEKWTVANGSTVGFNHCVMLRAV